MTAAYRLCAVIPTYNNPETIEEVAGQVLAWLKDVIVVDDGSDAAGREAVARMKALPGLLAHFRGANGGKGAAVMDGLRIAFRLGFTHVLQIDADGQHDTRDIPRFLGISRESPASLVLGTPVFDKEAPRSRLVGRRISCFWVSLETLGWSRIHDPLCGFRIYPVQAALATRTVGRRMDFDPEIAVRMVWNGVPVINLPTKVRYFPPEVGGVSHFRMLSDNLWISWMHTRLVTGALRRLVFP